MNLTGKSWLALALAVTAPIAWADAQGAEGYEYGAPMGSASSTAYPTGDFAAQLSAARGDSESGACQHPWGCGGTPFRTGPGRCDDWRVGPRWSSQVDAVFMFRDEIDLSALAAGATAGGVAIDPTAAGTISENMEYGVGARLQMKGHFPQCRGYELQIDYMGVFNFQANAFDPNVPYAGPLPAPPGSLTQKGLSYESALHSISVNAQTRNEGPVKVFGGVRYVLLSEKVDDVLDESAQTPLVPPNAGAAIAGDPPLDVTDIARNVSSNNNLLGIQGGMRTEFFQLTNRFSLEGFISGGAFMNFTHHDSLYRETRTYIELDDASTTVNEGTSTTSFTSSGYDEDRMRLALVAEAHLGAVYQVNRCTKARLGYQAIYLDGVELGNESFLGVGPTGDNLLMHGWFAGAEYRR